MRVSAARYCLLACLTAGALVPDAFAQELRQQEPQLQLLEEVNAPAAPFRPSPGGEAAASETRLPGGRVTEIKVKSGASTYYLRPQTAAGGARRDSGRTAQWNVFNFNAPQTRRETAEAAPAPVPPPPRPN